MFFFLIFEILGETSERETVFTNKNENLLHIQFAVHSWFFLILWVHSNLIPLANISGGLIHRLNEIWFLRQRLAERGFERLSPIFACVSKRNKPFAKPSLQASIVGCRFNKKYIFSYAGLIGTVTIFDLRRWGLSVNTVLQWHFITLNSDNNFF